MDGDSAINLIALLVSSASALLSFAAIYISSRQWRDDAKVPLYLNLISVPSKIQAQLNRLLAMEKFDSTTIKEFDIEILTSLFQARAYCLERGYIKFYHWINDDPNSYDDRIQDIFDEYKKQAPAYSKMLHSQLPADYDEAKKSCLQLILDCQALVTDLSAEFEKIHPTFGLVRKHRVSKIKKELTKK